MLDFIRSVDGSKVASGVSVNNPNKAGDAPGAGAEQGALPEEYEYNPYGLQTTTGEDNGKALDTEIWNISFQGGFIDALTGLVHFGARDYVPIVGRWIEQDTTPAAYIDGAGEFQLSSDG